jgi:imidazolonepropionase-like amidohydrolase
MQEGIEVSLAADGRFGGISDMLNLPFAAGTAAAYGLSREEALKMVTLNPAKVLGIQDRAGSLELGKDASFVVSDGDLLDMKSNRVEMAFISGRKIDLDNKHKRLYKKYSEKYSK